MSDPIGTVGTRGGRDDISIAMAGGLTFMQRVEHLGRMKDAHDEAWERLNLGNDAVAARAQAQKDIETAAQTRAAADRYHEEATSRAARVTRKAQDEAKAIKAKAEQEAAELRAQAERDLQDAQEILHDANDERRRAVAERSSAEASQRELDAKHDEHARNVAGLAAREQEVEALARKMTAGAAALRKVLNESF